MKSHARQFTCLINLLAAFCVLSSFAHSQPATPRRVTQTPEQSLNLNPSISGDGRHIAFESTAQLAGANSGAGFRALRADISGEPPRFTQVATSRAPAPAISQDGSRVAFSSRDDLLPGRNVDGNFEIFFFDGAVLRQITQTTPGDDTRRATDGNFQPSLSDDGRWLAFSSNRNLTGANADGNAEIFLYDTAQQTFRQLTDSAGDIGALDAKLSGDGTRVAFIKDNGVFGGDSSEARDLLLFELPTNSARVLAANVNGLALTFGRAISDDGTRVVYAGDDGAGVSQVFFYDGRNNLSRQATFLRARSQDVPLHPTISGDGSRVAFATRRNVTGGNSDSGVEVYFYDIPTNAFSRVTDAPAQATAEIVSSLDDEGSMVVFNFPRILSGPLNDADFTNNSEIYVAHLPARAPFSNDLQVTHAATHGRDPSNEKVFAPAQIAYATGTNLALISAQTNRLDDRTFPRAFANTQVLVNRRPAQLLFISPTRADFVIPPETETGAAEIVVRNHDGYESQATVSITPSAPGVFTESGDGAGAAIALDAETFLRAPFDPIDARNNVRRLSLFATGVRGALQVEVFINHRPLTVEIVAPTPDFPGLDEIHVVLQRSLAGAGVVPLVVRADGRESNPTTIHLSGTRRAASVSLTPTSARVGVGRAVQFTATAFDAEGAEIANAPITFSSLAPGIAVIDSSGVARGINAGMTTIMATAGDVSARATVEVFPLSLVINEALADPPDGLAGDANLDGVRSASQDEFVEIVNASTSDLDLGGYQILTRGSNGTDTIRHTFAARTIVPPGTAIVIFGGAETSSFNPRHPAFGGALVQTASTGGLSLLNGGSTITLLAPSGAIVEQLTYGGATTLEGDRNQSLTRAPDITGAFTLHQAVPEANARAFSPGTQLNAAPFAISVTLARIDIEPLTATIINGAQQQFMARAFAADGSEIPGVLFDWQSSARTIASIDQMGLARGLEPGTSLITASARGLQSNGATLQVTNPLPIIRRIEITPAALELNRGNSQQLTARAFDVNNQEVAPVLFNWSSNDPQIAIVDQAGLSRAVGLGTTSIIASAPDGAGGTISAQASITARAPLVINEIHADVAPDNATTPAVEGDANRDGVRSADDDEFIELINNSAAPLDLSGIVIADSTNNRFTFPANTALAAGRAVLIFGGGAPPLNDPAFGGSLVFTTNSLGLNDGGDTVNVKLPLANSEVVIAAQSYGSASMSGTPTAPSDQSLTRAPDAETGAGGDFAAHSSLANAAGRSFSPGTRADGTPFGSAPITRSEITPATAAIDINATQSFTARAFANASGVESEIHNVSFAWDASDQGKATVAPLSGSSTVATGLAPGSVIIRARAGGQQATANLNINPPPSILTRIEIAPTAATASLGATQQFTARGFDQNNQEMMGITFNWVSSDPNVAIIDQSGLATGVGIGSASITASSGQVVSNAASLQITPPVIPSAGQLLINEALVSFSSSTTQPRADFIELYNTTAQTLDISGLSISFRPSGSSNTERTLTLPGAIGSATTLVRPNAYFLIINGPQTFGATIETINGIADGFDAGTFNSQTNYFDLNNTTGGIKLEINGVKLDGLTYQGGTTAPAPPFNTFGEGALLIFSSGTTNDLLRSPNAADTNNNATDFRRNGVIASVTPKAPNP